MVKRLAEVIDEEPETEQQEEGGIEFKKAK